jgi:hypothetical protein
MTSRQAAQTAVAPLLTSTRGAYRVGQAISALVTAFLMFDGVARTVAFAPYLEGTLRAGFDVRLAAPIGILLIGCTLLYALPRTAVLGAVLLTGYLGAATAVNLRIGDPIWFPVLFGAFLWGGLYLREPRLGALLPLRRDP